MSAAPEDKPIETAGVTEAAAPLMPAIPGIGPTPADTPRPDPQPVPFTRPPTGAAPRLFLAVTGVAVVGWFAWLSFAALNKSREPVVSRVQAAVAPIAVRAEVAEKDGKPDTIVTRFTPLTAGGPTGSKLLVTNLPAARGFVGAGEYLLLLAPDPNAFLPDDSPVFQLVSVRTAGDFDPPAIYRWGPDVEAQAKRLYAKKD